MTAALLICALPTQASAACQVEHLGELPVTMGEMGPIVEAKLNGATLKLLVVSSITISQISPAALNITGLKLGSQVSGDDIRDENGRVRNTVAVSGLEIGNAIFPPLTFLVTPIMKGVDGYIGYEFSDLSDIEYDVAKGSVRFIKPHQCPKETIFDHHIGGIIHTADMIPDGPPYLIDIHVKLNGVNLIARISTTSPNTTLYSAAAKKAGLKLDGSSPKASMSTSLENSILKIGDEETSGTGIFIDDRKGSVDMILGWDFLKTHDVYVARKSRKVYFIKIKQ